MFAVPSCIVDEHLALCGALQLKVLLLMLRNSSAPMAVAAMAKTLHQSEGNIIDALGYWLSCGLISEENVPAAAPPVEEKADCTVKELYNDEGRKTVIITGAKSLSRSECLTMAQTDRELSRLLTKAQELMGTKTMTSADIQCLTSLYSFYGLACDYIIMVMGYCKSQGKLSMRYVEKTVVSWVDDEIDTYEKAEMYIKKLTDKSTNEGRVKTAFGIGDRGLTSTERKFIATWFNDFGYDIALVRLAYERCIDSIGKLSFPYINKILQSWYAAGVKTAKDAADEAANKKNGAAKNMMETSYNIDELDDKLISDFIGKR